MPRPRRGATLAVGLALLLAEPAGAHIDATPAFLAAGSTETIALGVHNDRPGAMSRFVVVAPPEVRIDGVGEPSGWTSSTDGRTATWAGGSLAPADGASFEVSVEAPSEPGSVILEAEQHYPDGGVLRWPVQLTVVPADGSTAVYIWVVIAGAFVLLALAGVALAWRRRSGAS